MRVITRQNIWHNGEVHPAGSLVEMSDELASQLVFEGLVEAAESVAPTQTQEREPTIEVEPPKKQTRKRKK